MKKIVLVVLAMFIVSIGYSYDIVGYYGKKAKGLVSVQKVGTAYVISEKRFSQETGEEIQPVITQIQIQDLEAENIELQAKIDTNNQLIAELKAL